MATVLSGTSGALYYSPAGTSVTTLTASAFPSSGGNITVGSQLGYKVNDTVTLAYPSGSTVTNCIQAGDYFVKTYDASTGEITGPAFEDDRPFFISRIETNFQATVIS